MKSKSFFSQIVLLIILSVFCIVTTVAIALFVGSNDITLFNFENLNFANMLPVLFIGGFLSCVVVGITFLFIARSVFYKVKNYFDESDGGDKQ